MAKITEQVQYPEIAEELSRRVAIDQAERSKENPDQEKIKGIDQDNTTWLEGIVEQYGWPKVSSVGKKGAENACLLAQHADHRPDLQKRWLDLMSTKPVDKRNIAYLTDRVMMKAEGRQLYGTQFYPNDKRATALVPVIDPKNLDKRRNEMGLESFNRHYQDS